MGAETREMGSGEGRRLEIWELKENGVGMYRMYVCGSASPHRAGIRARAHLLPFLAVGIM